MSQPLNKPIPEISATEWGTVRRAINRVWSHSKRYTAILHSFRVECLVKPGTYWYTCNHCLDLFRGRDVQLDHIEPVVPLDQTSSEIPLGIYAERRLCSPIENHQVLCKPCHSTKTKLERAERTRNRRTRMGPAAKSKPRKSKQSTGSTQTETSTSDV